MQLARIGKPLASTMVAAITVAFCWIASAQGAPDASRFIVATVQRSANTANTQTYRSGGFLRGSRYDLRKVTMLDLINLAYGFEAARIVGGPDWLELDRFDMAAKAPPETPPERLKTMLQSLLTDRFHLKVHDDTRLSPAFVLAQASEQPKMKPAEGTGVPECRYLPQPAGSTETAYSCRQMTMDLFVKQLRAMANDYLADPVSNATGLMGAWDFDLTWNYRSQILPAGVERTTIFTAIAGQLGLSLKPDKMPTPVIVVDSVNEQPTPDPPNAAALLPPRELQFEVASVKRSGPDRGGGGLGVTPGGGFKAGETMRNLFATAWDIHWDHVDELVLGMPKWMETARYEILARPAAVAPGSAPPRSSFIDDELRLMLRNLLIDRFKIRTHYENRPVNAYTLTAAKPRLTKAAPGNRANCAEARTVENDPRNQNPRLSRLLDCRNVTMAQFAALLLPQSPNDFAYPVIDATGLSGRWDFLLSYTPTGDRRNPAGTLFAAGGQSQRAERSDFNFRRGFTPTRTQVATTQTNRAGARARSHRRRSDGELTMAKPLVARALLLAAPAFMPAFFTHAPVLLAQNLAPNPTSAEPGATFEVASIKFSRPEATGKAFIYRGHQFSTIHTSVHDLISYSWGVHARQIVGGPSWLDADKFDIIAKPGLPEPSAQQLKEMTQAMLMDRFHLAFHREKKELSVFAIVVGKTGPKLTKTNEPGDLSSLYFPAFGTMTARIASMEDLARTLQEAVFDQPVIDQTGLSGRYDFTLKWTPDEFQLHALGTYPAPPPDQTAAPDFFTAIQQQLGLKLESTKAPVDVFVIDHIEKASEN